MLQVRKKREFIKIRQEELKADESSSSAKVALIASIVTGNSNLWRFGASWSCANDSMVKIAYGGCVRGQVAVPAPDPALPPSFDVEGNSHRYRFLESNGGWIARFVTSHG